MSEIKVQEYLTEVTGTCPLWANNIGEVLFTDKQIQARVAELGKEITAYYSKKENAGELIVVGLLKGSAIFLADLIRHIAVPYKVRFALARGCELCAG